MTRTIGLLALMTVLDVGAAVAQTASPQSQTIIGGISEAPIGHRQPRASDVPDEKYTDPSINNPNDPLNKENAALDRKLKGVCRGCEDERAQPAMHGKNKIGGSAMAAELPVKAPYAPPPAPLMSWSGFYIGGNVGYSAGHSDTVSSTTGAGGLLSTSTGDMSVTGAIGGGQLGYNWQFDPNWVIGVEGDFDWADQHGRTTLDAPITGLSGTFENKIVWLATVRGRLGYLSGSALWYVTGGWADAKRDLNASASVTGLAAGTVSGSQTKSGWTVGGGVETKLWNSNWSAKLEYLHVDLGTDTVTFNTFTTAAPIVAVTSHTTSSKLRDEIVRIGLNYDFW